MQNISSHAEDELPESVVIWEILLRLPAEDILRFRAVRKSWRDATSNREFLLQHHRRQPSLPVISLIKREGNLFDRHLFVYFDASPGAVSRKLSQQTILRYSNPSPYKDNPVIHGSCDGLLVVSFSCDNEGYFDVCNPITRQRAPLPLTRDDHEDGPPVTGIRIAGFYQHLASKEYRVLYSVCTRNADFVTSKVDFHVLAVGNNEPRPIAEPPLQQDLLDRLTCSRNAPVLNQGNLHWLLAWNYTGDDSSNIIVFDTEVETFRWMQSPPCQYPWNSLLELDGALAMFSSRDGIVIDIHVMHDYKAKVWAPTYHINLSALEASPQLHLPGSLHKIAALNGHELLIELPGCIMHCDLDGKFLGKMECDEGKHSRMDITSFRFQESIVPLPLFGMQEDYGDNVIPEYEVDDEVLGW